jgi:large subunit ribosomal protein L10
MGGREAKAREIERVSLYLKQYKAFIIASLHKIRTPFLQNLKQKFSGEALFTVTKNRLARLALKKSGKPNAEKLCDELTGENLFIFTNADVFKLSAQLRRSRFKVAARAGDVAPRDIIVPAGNTGFPAGPIVSEFSKVSLPTKIDSGSVVIMKDTVVAKKGEVISPELASVLFKLGIEPIEMSLSLRVAYDDGLVMTPDVLQMDEEVVMKELQKAASQAYSLALNTGYPTLETLPEFIRNAGMEAHSLALTLTYPTLELMSEYIRRAQYEAVALSRGCQLEV